MIRARVRGYIPGDTRARGNMEKGRPPRAGHNLNYMV